MLEMAALADWLPSAVVGLSFTVVGALKLYGLSHGVIGGAGKPASTRLCGSCPTWSSTRNVAVTFVFLAIGLGNLAYAAWVLARPLE